jgi:hypothetical protein
MGIDKLGEIMELINEYEIGRKYGKTMTLGVGTAGETKYNLDEFKELLMDNKEFYDSIKEQILRKINNQIEIKEDATSEI